MKLQTTVDISPASWQIGYEDKILMLGSCFADSMGEQMMQRGLNVTVNPFGTLYNPLSIAQALKEATVVIVTFGTAWVYEQAGRVVGNCHKLPESSFTRRRLSVEEIVAAWQPILNIYPDKHWLFTVSPIRHIRDGLHENQLSKATLLQAVEQLGDYFPSYEIMLDELRDYRFYADDLVHPSSLAINYIWERFADTFCSTQTRNEMTLRLKQFKQSQHRPLH